MWRGRCALELGATRLRSLGGEYLDLLLLDRWRPSDLATLRARVPFLTASAKTRSRACARWSQCEALARLRSGALCHRSTVRLGAFADRSGPGAEDRPIASSRYRSSVFGDCSCVLSSHCMTYAPTVCVSVPAACCYPVQPGTRKRALCVLAAAAYRDVTPLPLAVDRCGIKPNLPRGPASLGDVAAHWNLRKWARHASRTTLRSAGIFPDGRISAIIAFTARS